MFALIFALIPAVLAVLLVLPNVSRARAIFGRSHALTLAWEAIEDATLRAPADVFCARAFGLAFRCAALLLAVFACFVALFLSTIAPGGVSVVIAFVLLAFAVAFAASVPELERRSEDCERDFVGLTRLNVAEAAASVRTGARKGTA